MLIESHEKLEVVKWNLENVQELLSACDLKSEIETAVNEDKKAVISIFAFTYEPGAQRGDLLVIHSRGNRAGICFGGNSDWGDWDSLERTITLDTGEKYYEDGEEVEPEKE